jgi:hypothetical protein
LSIPDVQHEAIAVKKLQAVPEQSTNENFECHQFDYEVNPLQSIIAAGA